MTKLHTARNQRASAAPGDRYKWVALANTTGHVSYLLWMLMGYMLVRPCSW